MHDTALYLPWGTSFEGEQIPFPGILYRQILARGQLGILPPKPLRLPTHHLNDYKKGCQGDCPTSVWKAHHSGVSEIVPLFCAAEKVKEKLKCGHGEEMKWLERAICCGQDAPMFCYHPDYIATRMKDYCKLLTHSLI